MVIAVSRFPLCFLTQSISQPHCTDRLLLTTAITLTITQVFQKATTEKPTFHFQPRKWAYRKQCTSACRAGDTGKTCNQCQTSVSLIVNSHPQDQPLEFDVCSVLTELRRVAQSILRGTQDEPWISPPSQIRLKQAADTLQALRESLEAKSPKETRTYLDNVFNLSSLDVAYMNLRQGACWHGTIDKALTVKHYTDKLVTTVKFHKSKEQA